MGEADEHDGKGLKENYNCST